MLTRRSQVIHISPLAYIAIFTQKNCNGSQNGYYKRDSRTLVGNTFEIYRERGSLLKLQILELMLFPVFQIKQAMCIINIKCKNIRD